MEQKASERRCTSTHYVLDYYKVSGNSVKRFQRSCADKKNRTDESKTLYPPQFLARGIIKFQRGGQNYRMTDRTKIICPPIFDLRGIKKLSDKFLKSVLTILNPR